MPAMYLLKDTVNFILASASPRRKELLQSAGLRFDTEIPDCDERVLQNETAEEMVSRLSKLKAGAVSAAFPSSWVLGADTTVYINSHILGKPADQKEAFEMLDKLSGKWHEVWGGITLINKDKGISRTEAHCTRVLMRDLSEDDIRKFIQTGEPFDKAGAYAIQGVGAGLVSKIEGSYTNVVGLNLSSVIDMLKEYSLIS